MLLILHDVNLDLRDDGTFVGDMIFTTSVYNVTRGM
jgi:hypothetical protein